MSFTPSRRFVFGRLAQFVLLQFTMTLCCFDRVMAWTVSPPFAPRHYKLPCRSDPAPPPWFTRSGRFLVKTITGRGAATRRHGKKNNNNNNEDNDEDSLERFRELGMNNAFRELEALQSLGDTNNNELKRTNVTLRTDPLSDNLDTVFSNTNQTKAVPLEKEITIYQNMIKEIEDKSEDDLYSGVLNEMGGSINQTLLDDKKPAPMDSKETRNILMNQALEEALKKSVKLNNPSISSSILDDAEVMKEIEVIFQRGNEKLLQSLEEIRQEQRKLAQNSVDSTAREAVNGVNNEDARRLAAAEASMQTMIGKVNTEKEGVQRAVRDLQAAQQELNRGDFLLRLKQGGIVKQSALIGVLLFAVRSIFDTIAALTNPSLSTNYIATAVIQGGIAIACAIVFFRA